MVAFRNLDFEPYIKSFDISGISGRLFIATPQAKQWYDPINSLANLEFEWVVNNISLHNKKIIDCGAHHGLYSVILALAAQTPSKIISVDPYPMNCALIEMNMLLNQCVAKIAQCAVTDRNGEVSFSNQSNGSVITDGKLVVAGKRLDGLMHDAEIVKLDIEGEEYKVIPSSIDRMHNVNTWIIEIHPRRKPHPDLIIKEFFERDYKVLYLNKHKQRIEPYQLKSEWKIHSTIFAIKD